MAISILGNVLSKERKQISVFDFAAPVAGGCVFNGRVVFDSDELRQPASRKLTGVHFGSGCLMFIVAHSADVVQKILQVASVFTGSVRWLRVCRWGPSLVSFLQRSLLIRAATGLRLLVVGRFSRATREIRRSWDGWSRWV